MYYCKRALALRLGLFFFILFSPAAAENSPHITQVDLSVSAEAGTLLVQEDGMSLYWHNGFVFSPGRIFFMEFDFGKVYSDLNWIDGSVFGFAGKGGIDLPVGGLTLAGGYFSHSPLDSDIKNISINNEGGEGFFFSLETPLRLGPLVTAPFFLYGEGSWDDGDLYYFFGKPNLPSLFIYGLSAALDPHDRYTGYNGPLKHETGFRLLSADIDVISNEGQNLFDAYLDAGFFFFKTSLERENIGFSGTLGWLYVKASIEGALNTSNQPYFLFPYLVYDVDASFGARAGFANFAFRYNHGIFRYDINLGALYFFHDRGMAQTHYKKKKLFGGQERAEEIYPEISGLGAAFLFLEFSLPSLSFGIRKNTRLYLGLQKIFLLPWGYEKLLSSSET